MLIQCLWRCYAADKSFNSQATWDIYLKDLNQPKEPVAAQNLVKLARFMLFQYPDLGYNYIHLVQYQSLDFNILSLSAQFIVAHGTSCKTSKRVETPQVEKQNGIFVFDDD